MRARAAQVQSAHGRAVIGKAQHRPRREKLVQSERAVKDVTAGQAELALEVERRQDPAGEDALLEIRGAAVDRLDDDIRSGFFDVVPAAAIGQNRVEVLAEKACDVFSLRRE